MSAPFSAIRLEPLCPGCRAEDAERRAAWTGEASAPVSAGPAGMGDHDATCGRMPVAALPWDDDVVLRAAGGR